MSMTRYVVAGHSMSPTLLPGAEVVATRSRQPRVGELVVFEHPGRAGMWLIKRLADADGWVTSDNPGDADADSRTLGHLDLRAMSPVVTTLDEVTFVEACELLTAEDEALAGIVGRWGVPEFWHRRPGFSTLVLLVLEQQVSLESGAAMYRRVTQAGGTVTPGSIVALGVEGLRAIGVTRQKSGYLVEMSRRLLTGDVDLDAVALAPDETARQTLLSMKGVGPWTADAYLLSALRRPDMWPVGDRALQVGAAEALGMANVPDEEELEILAEGWRPVRAAAARLIWHSYLSERGRVEPPDPTLVHTD